MLNLSVQVPNLREVQELLTKASRTVASQGMVRALSAAANVIADEVERRTPVKKEDTGGLLDRGVLRESLMVKVTLDAQFRGGTAEIGFGKNGHVALWLEYGHLLLGRGAPGHRPILRRIPAYPFMRPAFEASAQPAVETFARVLEETVRKVSLAAA